MGTGYLVTAASQQQCASMVSRLCANADFFSSVFYLREPSVSSYQHTLECQLFSATDDYSHELLFSAARLHA